MLLEQPSRHRADATRADDVAGHARVAAAVEKWRVRDGVHRVSQLGTERGEVAGALRIGWDNGLTRSRLRPIPQSLIRTKPEKFVTDHRAAGAGAGLILLLLRLARLEEAAGVERRVAVEFPRRPMEIVRSRLRHDTHLAAGGMAVFSREIVRLDADLLHRIGRRRIEPGGLIEVGEDGAVQREQVVIRVAAVDRHDRSLPTVGSILLRADVGHVGRHAGQRHDVAAVHRQVLHALVVDEVRLRGVSRFHHRRPPRDDHFLGESTDLEHEVQSEVGAGGDFDVLLYLGLEPAHLDLDEIPAARERLKVEEAGRVRWSRANELLPFQRRGDRGARHRAAALILHVAADGATDLRLEGGGLQQNQQREKNTEQRQATSHRPNPLFREERHPSKGCPDGLPMNESSFPHKLPLLKPAVQRRRTGDKIYPAKYSNGSSIFFRGAAALRATCAAAACFCEPGPERHFSTLAGPHPRSHSLGGFAPRSGRRRCT